MTPERTGELIADFAFILIFGVCCLPVIMLVILRLGDIITASIDRFVAASRTNSR